MTHTAPTASETLLLYAARAAEHAARAQQSAASAAAKAGHQASPWYAVGAGLGAAVILALATLVVARRQRRQDVASLEKTLQHDREMRDLDHIREVIAPMITEISAAESPIDDLLGAIEQARATEDEKRGRILALEALVTARRLAADRASNSLQLVILLGAGHPVSEGLRTSSNAIGEASDIAQSWFDSGADAPISEQLAELERRNSDADVRFLKGAYEVAGRAEPTERLGQDAAPTVGTGANPGASQE